jgi:hypothetical protein
MPHCGGTGVVEVADVVERAIREEKVLYDGQEPIGDSLNTEVKWYEHEKDMKEFSKRFPKVLFTLRGEGEESGDVWVKYFQNGKMQVEKVDIKLGEFDPKKLS